VGVASLIGLDLPVYGAALRIDMQLLRILMKLCEIVTRRNFKRTFVINTVCVIVPACRNYLCAHFDSDGN